MANTLLITKETGGYFSFVLNGNTAKKIQSIGNDLLIDSTQCHFKTRNGANIIKEQSIYPTDVTLVAGGTFTFNTTTQLWNKLIEVGYFTSFEGLGKLDKGNYTGTAQTLKEDIDALGSVDVSLKLDKGGYSGTAQDLSDSIDTKLDIADYNERFKGVYLTLSDLNTAHPTASIGDYAQVNEVGATDVVNYNWDAEENIWIVNAVAGSGATNTDALPEGTSNLYFTVTRFLANLTFANIISALGFTPENVANKSNGALTTSTTTYPTSGAVKSITDTKANDNTVVHLSGSETITGSKIFNTSSLASSIIVNGGTGNSIQIGNTSGNAIFIDNATTGNGIVSDGRSGATGLNYVGRNAGVDTFKVDKLGATTASSFIKSGATAGNILLAGGTDIPQNTFQATLTNPITGTGTTNYVSKFTGAGTQGNSLIFDNGTSIGIGTTTPTEKLEVNGNIKAGQATFSSSVTAVGEVKTPALNLEVSGNPSVFFNSTYNEATNRNWRLLSNRLAFGEFDLIVSPSFNTSPNTSVLNFKSTGQAKFLSSVTATALKIETQPITSAGTYDVLTRNISTGVVEKKLSSDFQSALVSGTSIKTINGTSLLGSGDLVVSGSSSVIKTLATNTSDSYGDSIMIGEQSTTGNSFMELYASLYGLTNTQRGASGRGIWEATRLHNLNINLNHSKLSVVMVGFNDVRRGANSAKTISKIKNGYRAIICNQFAKTNVSANGGSASITTYGTWSPYNAVTYGGKSTTGASATSTGAFKQYAFTDNNVFVSFIGSDGVVETNGNFDVFIDGTLIGNYTANNVTDGISDGSNANTRSPYVLYFGGLTDGAHTIRITTTTSIIVAIDYFGSIKEAKFSQPLLFAEAPKMNTTGYTVAPNLATEAIINQLNTELGNVISEFNTDYPIFVAKTNDFYNPNTGASADNVHPSDIGYRQIYNSLVSATKPIVITPNPKIPTYLKFDDTWKSVFNYGSGDVNTNTSYGYLAIAANATGGLNSAFGRGALTQLLGGVQNTATGAGALGNNTTGSTNVASGVSALGANISGSSNVAVGFGASYLSTASSQIVAVGAGALGNNTGGQNTSIGASSMASNTSGYYNTSYGLESLKNNTTGYLNLALGVNAGSFLANGSSSNSTADNGIYIGQNSKASTAGLTNEIVIGNGAVGSGSNTVTLGDSAITKTVLKGVINSAKTYTVATLPTGVLGDRTTVTDALAPTFLGVVAGGGAVVTPVFYNGTNWVAH